MSLPLRAAPPTSQNARVQSFSVGGDESPRNIPPTSANSVDEVIEQAYRQIYFHAFKVDREPALESQLRNGQITVRDFVGESGMAYINSIFGFSERVHNNLVAKSGRGGDDSTALKL